MKSTLAQIEDIQKHGYTLDFSAVFNHALENFKKISLYSALIIFLFSIIFGIAILGIIGTIYSLETVSKELIKGLDIQNLSYTELFITTAGVSFVTALLAPFGAGFLKMADCADKDEEFNVSTIFYYYRAPYFIQLFVVTLITSLVSSAISNIIENAGFVFIGTTISIFINFFVYFSIPLIVFGKLNAIEALKSSFIIVTKNPLMIFAVFVIGFIGSMVGLVACGIGVLFTIVFNSSMVYATYYEIFTVDQEENPIDSIGRPDLE